jgi:hypothetical protein
MYCGECGTKCKVNDTFCPECGSTLKNESNSLEDKKKTPKKKIMSKKKKIIIAVVAVIALIMFGTYKLGSDYTSPKNVANRYIKAIINKDADELYNFLNIEGDTTFTSKKILRTLIENDVLEEIENYTITDVTYSDGKLNAIVSFKYTKKGSSTETTGQINLTKKKIKKLLIFDNWEISNSKEISIVDEYTVKVPKNSSLTYAGVKVSDKYLDASSNDSYDVYVIPQVFGLKTNVEATLINGITIENSVTPSTYSKVSTLILTKDNLNEDIQKSINEYAKKTLTTLYESAINEQSFEDIKENFDSDADLETLQSDYDSFSSKINSASNKLSKINITDISIYSLTSVDDKIQVRFKVNYEYTVKYKAYFSDEEKTHEGSNYSYMTITLGINKDNYYITSIDNLVTYFSRY